LNIAFPDLKATIMSAIAVCLHVLISALVFDISRRILPAIGCPADPRWAGILAALVGASTAVVSFPRRAVVSYQIQRAKLPGTHLVYEGQTGSGIVLLAALITAIPVVIAAASFRVAPTREHIGTVSVIYIFVYTAFMKLYKAYVADPLARVNGQAIGEGAYRTAQQIDAARKPI
jgi:hypothetical protein